LVQCGKSPFAVIAKAWVPEDQSIPEDVAASLIRRDGTFPEVKALQLAVDFDAASSNRRIAEPVNFAIRAANIPGAQGEIDTSPKERRSMMRVVDRGLFDFVKKAIDGEFIDFMSANIP